MTELDALRYWTGSDRETFVAEIEGRVVGTYYLRVNRQGGGTHVANCGYVMSSEAKAKAKALRGACASILYKKHANAASKPCNSTSS